MIKRIIIVELIFLIAAALIMRWILKRFALGLILPFLMMAGIAMEGW